MTTATTERLDSETATSAETDRPLDEREVLEELGNLPLTEKAQDYHPENIYVPPVLPEKRFEDSPEKNLETIIEDSSSERIDSIVLDRRENDPTARVTAEKVDATLEKARKGLGEYEKAKAAAKEQLAIDDERKNVDRQFSTAEQDQVTESKQDIVSDIRELIASLEGQTTRVEAVEQKISDLEQDIDEVRYRLDSGLYITDLEAEAMAKDGKKGLAHKLKSRFSYSYRTEEVEQYRQKTVADLEKELALQQGRLSEESSEAEQTNQDLEALIFGDIPASEIKSKVTETLGQIRQLDGEFKEARKSGKEPAELIDQALGIDALDTSLQVRIDGILSRVEQLKNSGDFQKLPRNLQEVLTHSINLEYMMNELKRARSINIDGSVIPREEILDRYARNRTADIINDFFKEQIYGSEMCEPNMSDELKFTPTVEQLKAVETLMSDGVTVWSDIIEIFYKSRARLELIANADLSYIAHVSTVNRALEIIESGGIKSPDILAAERGGETRDYANSPNGKHSGIVGESYFTLNDIERTYLGTDRYDSEYHFKHMIDDPKGELGAIFVGNLGVIGTEKAWYMRQNSQGKSRGAEEVVLKMDAPVPVEEMYIFIEDGPKAIEVYANALAKSGRSEEWIKEHLVPIKGVRNHGYGGQIGEGNSGRDIIYQTCIRRGILGQTDKEYVPLPEAVVQSQTNGGTAQTYRLKRAS
jgi:hypothetical protein